MEKKKMVEYILKGFKAYEEFVNKELHYVYKKDNVYKEVVFKANKKGFMHLCGVDYIDPKNSKKVSANHFYSLVKRKNISPSFLVPKTDGTTEQKLQVIENLKDILTPNVRVIDGKVTFYNMTFDKGLRSRRQIFALALIEENQYSEVYAPLSLLNLKVSKADSLKKTYEVHCIYAKSRGKDDFIYFESEDHKLSRLNPI
ncbi:PBECR4 domain-containing protein [Bacillus atrophaeus]|uniref:PBECR4 domain-containing protein n=1 Tax=Bacillus atrophaeus TaxID=1452 RepID=UPI002E1C51E9|nr:PBECR4 domain-containing protein [Bacillus atrophaeus]MED4850235.1 PBECR4 domain-containing protein [Bacillus atrophaeus]